MSRAPGVRRRRSGRRAARRPTPRTRRRRQQVPPDAEGLGPPPLVDTPEHDAWSRASTHLARTRIWLASHANGPTVPLTRNRSAAELGTRGEQLERIFAAAPPDQSRLIESLTTGQLTLDDAARALDQALATQGARRDWVLEHWPHIVEHAEITRSLTAHAAAPDLGGLLDQLASSGTAAGDDTSAAALVTAAARAGEPWLQGLLGNLVPAGTTHVDDATSELLGRVAVYRHRWRVSHRDPLGPAASTANQATERAVLEADLVAAAVDRSGRHVPADPQRAGHEVDRPVGATRDDLRTEHGLGI